MGGHVRPPHILADHDPKLDPPEFNGFRQRSGCKHPLFIEHAVIRQIDLEPDRGDLAPIDQERGVVKRAIGAPRGADKHRRAIFRRRREGSDRRFHRILENWLEDQVLGWIAADAELAEDRKIGAEPGGLIPRRLDARHIPLDVTDGVVELGQRYRQRVGHGTWRPQEVMNGEFSIAYRKLGSGSGAVNGGGPNGTVLKDGTASTGTLGPP